MQSDTAAYRPEIDGLRAVAVLAVLLYHLEVPGFQGGYVGVDVFFVISGFLITGLIVHAASAGRFSFAEFYVRRARRILPALFGTVASTLIAGFFLLPPSLYTAVGASAACAVLSVSNFYFWSTSGYFDTDAYLKPLLHTWSLGVEEQFYLVWPALVVGLFMRRPWLLVAALLVSSAAGLVFAEHTIGYDAAGAFYLPPSRVLEFAIGGLLLWMPRSPSAAVAEACTVVGCLLIAWSVGTFTADTPFPGLHSLPPCIGAALVLYGGSARWSGLLFRNRAVVGLGLISYSLYLVHWPLIVFYRFPPDVPLSAHEQLGLAIASIALATLMHRYVEAPIRLRRDDPRRLQPSRFVTACAAAAVVNVLLAAFIWYSDGWTWRVPVQVRKAVADLQAKQMQTWHAFAASQRRPFQNGKIRIAIVGDSHAKDFFNAIDLNRDLFPDVDLLSVLIEHDCQTVVGARPPSRIRTEAYVDECEKKVDAALASPTVRDADLLFIAQVWLPWSVDQLDATLDAFRRATSAQIVVVGQRPSFLRAPDHMVARGDWLPTIERDLAATRNAEAEATNASIEATADAHGATFLSTGATQCPSAARCLALDADNNLLYYDTAHWTLEGARFFGRRLLKDGTVGGRLLAGAQRRSR